MGGGGRKSEQYEVNGTRPAVAGSEDGGPQAKECGQPVEAGKGQEMDFALRNSRRNQSC